MLTRKKHSKIFLAAVCLLMATAVIFLLANFAMAANFWGDNTNGESFRQGAGLVGGTTDLRVIIANVIRTVIGFLGIIAVGLIIYAGFLWMTSGGDEQKIEQAKKILQNALVGLIIIVLSFAIVSFILNFFKGLGGGGSNNQPAPPPGNYGLSAIGNGIIQSHYPARDQKEVPRNTSIIITFRESMDRSTIIEDTNDDGIFGNQVDSNRNGKIDDGEADKMNKNVARIFEQKEKAECVDSYSVPADCKTLADAIVYSTDSKTFVFVPISYLGSPTDYTNYSVYLGSGLKRQTGQDAFPWAGGYYSWSFEVSNKIDLTPPQVKDNGVFPSPDNARDTTDEERSTDASQARGTITVNSPLTYSDASVSVSTENPVWNATVTVDRSCSRSGEFTVNVDRDNKNIIRLSEENLRGDNILLGQGTVSGQTVAFALCNLKLTLNSGDFAVSSLWTVTITPMIVADTITVGNTIYTASAVSGDNDFVVGSNIVTAQNIRSALANNPEVDVVPGTDEIVTIKAEVAGVAGNNINLSSSNVTRLPFVAMAGGTDKVDTVRVEGGRRDQPMNSAIQINFNEAIMPLTVSGASEEVKDFIRVVNAGGELAGGAVCQEDFNCKSGNCTSGHCLGNDLKTDGTICQKDTECVSYKCEGNPTKVCVNNELQGKFEISNQYATVEFLSDKECGFNTCGEKVYCLPANSHLKVELNAASLTVCANNADCQTYSPFNICDGTRKLCRDNDNKYYPQADKTKPAIVDGITDAAFNSLDGNRDNSAYGPIPDVYYNENTKAATDSDNYKWSFFISNILDLTPPKITAPTTPATGASGVDLIEAVKLSFNKLMLSSRLSTGSLTIQNGGQSILHNLLNLRSSTDQPLGYWVTNTQKLIGGEMVSTDVSINHTTLGSATTYTAQAGSGLKDIYQNCFLPCAADSGDCARVDSQKPCCCSGTPYAICP